MSENIELHSFRTNTARDSDIEEYHEINEDVQTTAFLPKYSMTTLKEYDFFTQEDVKVPKKDVKKKKAKKKETTSFLMDIISSELVSVAVPVAENVMSYVDSSIEQYNSYMERIPSLQRLFQRSRSHPPADSELGWRNKTNSINLDPILPRVLENTLTEDHTIPVQYIEPAIFNDLIADSFENDLKQCPKFLDIEIKNINFSHHHKFCLEQLLCVKLVECYNEYNSIQQTLKDIAKDVRVNRDTRNNLKEEFSKISPTKKEDIRFDQTVRKYTRKLLDLKEKYLFAVQKQKEMVHKIISLWSDIEMVREKIKNIATPYILEVKKNVLDQEEFQKHWSEVFNIEFSDMLDKIEYEYVNKYIEYKEVKNTQNLDDSAKKRIGKPKLKIDEGAVREEVEAIVNNIVTEDKVEVTLKQDNTIISELNMSGKSILKRKYYFEIYVDDIFVCESVTFLSKTDKISDVDFTEIFSVQILPRNRTLAIILFENDREYSTLKISLADISKTHLSSEFVSELFICNDILAPNSKHVGSGYNIKDIAAENKVRLKSSNLFKGNLYTTCECKIKMGWDEKTNGNNMEVIKSTMEIGRQLKRCLHGVDKPSVEVLIDIIGKLYGKDVTNDETMIRTLRNVCKTDSTCTIEETFPIDENSPEFVRLKLLYLRSNGGFTNVENKLIPVHASQISTEQLNCSQKCDENEFDAQYLSDKYVEMDPIEVQRYIGSRYVQKLNKNMLKNLNEHLLRKTHKDVVRDFKDLSLRSIFTNQTNLATLANISSCTRQQLLAEGIVKDQEIRITVMRAFNLLDRSVAILDDEDDEQIAGFKVRPLRPFVRLSYHGASVQTATAIGCHPTWNQTVKINTRMDPLSSLHINVFDEHAAQRGAGGDGPRPHRHSRWLGGLLLPLRAVLASGELRGTFKVSTPPIVFGYENLTKDSTHSFIPAVTQLMKKDTSFISVHISTSLSHLGGLNEYNQPTNPDDNYLIKHLNSFVTEYTNDFPSRNISLTFIDSSGKNKCVTQFLQPIPLPDYESFPKNPKSIRAESALSKSSGLSKSSSSRSSGRRREEEKVSINSGEERESIYSIEGSWRNGESQMTKLMNASLRYVALIPTYEVTESHTVTLLGLELLKVLYGSPLDHTLLLASYFLHLGIRCWVAIGQGLPRGLSSYVLIKYDLATHRVVSLSDQERRGLWSKKGYVWYVCDANSGEKSELRDVGCPMKTVNFVFDNENIWVNTQSSQDCESVSFDFARSSDWQPVFDKTIFVMKLPVADSEVGHCGDVSRLRAALETKLRERVCRWRPRIKTVWNRYCSGLLRDMLPHWEHWALNPAEPKPALSQRLKQLMATYRMFGFLLNLPYSDAKSVISSVKATGAHVSDDPNAEFALAVELYAYPNNVISVWVFLASITRL